VLAAWPVHTLAAICTGPTWIALALVWSNALAVITNGRTNRFIAKASFPLGGVVANALVGFGLASSVDATRQIQTLVASLTLPSHDAGAGVGSDALAVDAPAGASDVAIGRFAAALVPNILPTPIAFDLAFMVTRVPTLITLQF